ncbi:hypothetical protein Tco_1342075, partial [Tanacetum coccineum]
ELVVSRMKAFRAKSVAINQVKGDYRQQYLILRDYCLELRRANPNTTIKIEVERDSDPKLQIRVFKRIYKCLEPLKKCFKAGGRDMLGLDGAFMKGPYPGQLLTAVGLECNNCIYPLAYAIVEKETIGSWTWFLECLGDDLGMSRESNFTFISDRKKHIHENMKQKWNGQAYKDPRWRCVTTTTVSYFDKEMEELKSFNSDAFEWLSKIPAHTWSRSHFLSTTQRSSTAATRKRPSNVANNGNGPVKKKKAATSSSAGGTVTSQKNNDDTGSGPRKTSQKSKADGDGAQKKKNNGKDVLG